MTKSEFEKILEIFILGDKAYEITHRVFIGDRIKGAISMSDEGLFAKIIGLDEIIKNNSIYANRHEDSDLEEFLNIIFSEELSLGEKVDRLYCEKE